jgi:ribosome-binding protein aMBF1 (putative translation factor)
MPVPKRRKKLDLTAWQQQNPLRLWRLKQPPEGWNRSLFARQINVSHTAVGSWEKGERLPSLDAFAKIEKLTGIKSAEWMAWIEKKPMEK